MKFHSAFAFSVAMGSLAPPVLAQEKPAGLLNQSAASSGRTDVAKDGFETLEKDAASAQDATELNLIFGGLIAAGNSRSIAATGASRFRLRRGHSQGSLAAAANYGESAVDRNASMEPTVANYQGRVRYDYFLSRNVALFLAASARRDRFQGLDLRFNLDPGVAYYFVVEEKHRLWTEVGYDYQYDVRSEDAIASALANDGTAVDKTAGRHNARGFAGYENTLNEDVTLSTGVEYLQGLSPFEDDTSGRTNWRLNWDFSISAKLAESFALATTISVKYDNNPLPDVKRGDAVTAINLVYNTL
jgi:putative salt-induced outer membrane protein